MELYSPSKCFEHSHKIKTVKDAISLPSKTLQGLKKIHGREWIIGYISMWLINLNDTTNVKNKMSDVQIEFTSIRIFETYSLKITDMTLFFRNVKEGVYGDFYENISQEKIMNWLAKYFDQRCEYAQMMSQGNSEAISLTKNKINPEVIEKMFKGVGDEEVNHNSEKNGIGRRFRTVLKKAKVITNRTDYLNSMYLETKRVPDEELQDYLINTDVKSKDYDHEIYEIVERELERRQ
ncbi:hypothetical protein ACFSTE_13200 [Aquimarina hainanensis]|uniref:Uncharacterized protein n=1 Tax=Aquimarina hainanensis TaxID=1578017 RepID=A0ABW5N844_9FLAO